MNLETTMRGITIIGGNFFEVDDNEDFFNTLATIFPGYGLMVIGRGGIHADQICTATDYLKQSFKTLANGAVFLNLSKDKIIVRVELHKIVLALVADELLQRLLPKSRIQFTGLHLAEVRNIMRLRGEIWRIAPAPVEEKDFLHLICNCRFNIGTGIKYLYNKHTGEHVLSYQEFMRIRPLIQKDIRNAIERLKEIVELSDLINNQGYPELAFLLPADEKLEISALQEIISLLESGEHPSGMDEAESLFDWFSKLFEREAGPELTTDDPKCSRWRATALCRLYNIDEKTTAEWALGLGPEFYLNIQWLPGARISKNDVIYDTDVNPRVKNLIDYYRQTRKDLISINVGRIKSPMARRDSTGEEREVYIVALGLPNEQIDVRHVRMSKWGVRHRLGKGESIAQAIDETRGYRNYIIDRLTAARALGLSIPVFKEIDVEDEVGKDIIPVYYFEREYVPGIVTSRISPEFYARKGFISRLSRLLGMAAAASLVLGRRDPRSHDLYFDDGDEAIQLNEDGLPEKLIMIETTGSFADWTTPLSTMLPHCLEHLKSHIDKARQQGIETQEILKSAHNFADGLITEIQRMQRLLNEPISIAASLFSDRTKEPEGIRSRWEGILNRLQTADINELRGIIENEFGKK